MFCSNCGKEIREGSTFCQYCGSKVEQGYISPDSVGRQPGNDKRMPAASGSGKGKSGKFLCIAGVAAAVCVMVALVVVLVLFVKGRVADGNLSTVVPFLAEDDEGKILGGKLDKSSLPGFVRKMLGEEEEAEEEDAREEEEALEEADSSERLSEENPEELFQAVLSELVSVHGVFREDQRGIMRSPSDLWMNPQGIISASIEDFDLDGEEEMMVCHTEPSGDNPDSYEILMSMYEIEQGAAVLADQVLFHAYNDKLESSACLSKRESRDMALRVNILRNHDHTYIICEEESITWAFADGQERNYWAMIYEEGRWEYAFSFTETAGGSAGFVYTGYELEKGTLVNAQVYYDERGMWRDTDALYEDYATAIREFFGKFEIPLKSHPSEYEINTGSLLSDDNDKTAVFEWTNEMSHVQGQSMVYQCHAVLTVDPASTVFGEPAPALDSLSSSAAGGDYLLPDADSRYLTREELGGLSKEELRLARNEIYARHGRLFNGADLQNYFNGKSWYQGRIPANQFSDSVFNDYERKNLDLIRQVEESRP